MINLIFNRKQRHSLRECLGSNIWAYRRKVYVVGDSHVFFFTGINAPTRIPIKNPFSTLNTAKSLLPCFQIYHLGPGLAYNINKRGSSNQTLEKLHFLLENQYIPPRSTLMLSLGEIDCRVHLPTRISSSLTSLTGNPHLIQLTKNYQKLTDDLLDRGYRVICWAPIATQSDSAPPNQEFPRNGTEELRNRITGEWTRQLKQALAPGIPVISLLKRLLEHGQTGERWLYDGCHLSSEALPLLGEEMLRQKVWTTSKGILNTLSLP